MARRNAQPSASPSDVENLLQRAKQLRYYSPKEAFALAEDALRKAQALGNSSLILNGIWELAICAHILNDYPQTIAWAELLMQKAILHHSPERQANAHTMQGIGYMELGYLDKALEHFHVALMLHEQGNRARSIASTAHNIGNIYVVKGQFELALSWYQRALALREFASRELLARLLNSIGYAYYNLGNHSEALKYYTQCLETTEADDFKFMQVTVLGNLTDLYLSYGDYTTAMHFCNKALTLSEQIGNQKEIANGKLSLGTIYLQMGDIAAATVEFASALAIAKHLSAKWMHITAQLKLGEAFIALSESSKAIEQFSQAQQLAQASGYVFSDAQARLLWAKALYATGAVPQAQSLLVQGLALAQQIGAKVLEQQYHEVLSMLHRSLGDFTSSVRHSKQAEALQTQLFANATTRRLLVEFETKRFLEAQSLPKPAEVEVALQLARKAIEQKHLGCFARRKTTVSPSLQSSTKPSAVFVKTFGEFSVTIDGRTLTKADWQRKKARDIFKILLIHHQKAVTADELIEWLWGNETERDLQQVIKNSISFIRKALEPHLPSRKSSSFLRTEGKAYTLDLGEGAFIDFLAFKALIQEAARVADKYSLYKKAVSLYTGDFLKEDLYEEWAAFERETLKDAYLNALAYLAESALRQAYDEDALLYARQLITAEHTSDKGYAVLLKVLVKQGHTAEAHRLYKQCKDAFERELGTSPPSYLQALLPNPPQRE